MPVTAEQLLARAEIVDVLALYCHAIDRRQWHLLGRCFHSDARFRFGAIDGSWQEFVSAARAVIDPLRMSQHRLGQTLFAFVGDVATTETYMTAYHRVAAEAPTDAAFPGTGVDQDIVIAGRYVDRFERRHGNWRIVSRIGLTDYRQQTNGTDFGLFDTPQDWRGDIGPDDPACAVGATFE